MPRPQEAQLTLHTEWIDLTTEEKVEHGRRLADLQRSTWPEDVVRTGREERPIGTTRG